MVLAETFVRAFARQKRLRFSKHAIERMGERCIRDVQVFDCAANGPFVELQFHGRDAKVVFHEPTKEKPEFYVVIAATLPMPVVITICRTQEEVWEYFNGLFKRKGK